LSGITRRQLSLGLAATFPAAGLLGCGRKPESQQEGTPQWAVSGRWRNNLDKGRDPFRHPLEMMDFFEIQPRDVVVDVWPGAGYMTDILGPYLTRGKGRYVAALFPASGGTQSATGTLSEKYRERFSSDKKLYGAVEFSEFGPETAAITEGETADVVLMLQVVHDLMAAGIVEKAFADAFAALRPGGILGVEQHRADIGNVQDPGATSGYVQEPFVKQLAFEAGFAFDAASEINANPKDDKDHPFGVWTLPPQRLTSARGQPPNPEFDGTVYESIGESDRMTLKFRKPQ
jgi:predicted methyltransferase